MLRVFAVFDVKSAAYGPLMVLATRGLAMRAFADACAARDSVLAQYPADFTLYELGGYDQNTGKLEPMMPDPVCTAAACLQLMRATVAAEKVAA